MKRVHLIEYGIVVIALLFGYKAFEGFFSLIAQLVYAEGVRLSEVNLLKSLIVVVIYLILFILLIRNSWRIAYQLDTTTNPSESDVHIKLSKRSILQIILITLAVTTILADLSYVLLSVFGAFKKAVGSSFDETSIFIENNEFNLLTKVIEIVLAVIVIYTSKNLASLLLRKDDADELVFDSKSEN